MPPPRKSRKHLADICAEQQRDREIAILRCIDQGGDPESSFSGDVHAHQYGVALKAVLKNDEAAWVGWNLEITPKGTERLEGLNHD